MHLAIRNKASGTVKLACPFRIPESFEFLWLILVIICTYLPPPHLVLVKTVFFFNFFYYQVSLYCHLNVEKKSLILKSFFFCDEIKEINRTLATHPISVSPLPRMNERPFRFCSILNVNLCLGYLLSKVEC